VGIFARGGLEPHFRVLFSAIFQGFIRENFHQGRNQWNWAEPKVWSFVAILRTKFLYVWQFYLSTGYQKYQFDELLSTQHSFAPPIPPGLLWGRQTLARRLRIDYPRLVALIYSPAVYCWPCDAWIVGVPRLSTGTISQNAPLADLGKNILSRYRCLRSRVFGDKPEMDPGSGVGPFLISRANVSNSLVIYPWDRQATTRRSRLRFTAYTEPLDKAVAMPVGSHGEIGFK
jgi:hypothetical protein